MALVDRAADAQNQRWLSLQTKRYVDPRRLGAPRERAPPQRIEPEVARKLVKDAGDLTAAKYAKDRNVHLAQLRFLPRGLLKLLETMPMPWEPQRKVECLVHKLGALTLPNETPRAIPAQFTAAWATMWLQMRAEKKRNANFRRRKFPCFDDGEHIMDFGENIEPLEIPDGVQMDLTEDDDASVKEWIYEHQPRLQDFHDEDETGPAAGCKSDRRFARLTESDRGNVKRGKYWLSRDQLAALSRLALPLVAAQASVEAGSSRLLHSQQGSEELQSVVVRRNDPNLAYLIDQGSLRTSKALAEPIPGGPRFEPLYEDSAADLWVEFEDSRRVVHRGRGVTGEMRVAFPHMYASDLRGEDAAGARYRRVWDYGCYHAQSNVVVPPSVAELDSGDVLRSGSRPHVLPVGEPADEWWCGGGDHSGVLFPAEIPKTKEASPAPATGRAPKRVRGDPMVLAEAALASAGQSPAPYSHTAPARVRRAMRPPMSLLSHFEQGQSASCALQLPNPQLQTRAAAAASSMTLHLDFFDAVRPAALTALEALHLAFPFDGRSGQLRRMGDCPLVEDWVDGVRVARDARPKVKRAACVVQKSRLKARLQFKTRTSKLLTGAQTGVLVRSQGKRVAILEQLSRSDQFRVARLDWVEAGLQLLKQAHNMLNILILRKQAQTVIAVDNNFNMKALKLMSTKERKRARFGQAFNLVRSLCRLLKFAVDAHVKFRLGDISAFQLADSLQYLFAHVGTLTEAYRAKYRVMRTIKLAKAWKTLTYDRFNAHDVGRGPGCGFWLPTWRVWLFWLRGMAPLLEGWLGDLLVRVTGGRVHNRKGLMAVTKQRMNSVQELEVRKDLTAELLPLVPPGTTSGGFVNAALGHFAAAFRSKKANKVWHVPGLPAKVEAVIHKYVKIKWDHYVTTTISQRAKLDSKVGTLDKALVTINTSRMSRLKFRAEAERQEEYARKPFLTADGAVKVVDTFAKWLEARKWQRIPVPETSYKDDKYVGRLALEGLRQAFANGKGLDRLTGVEKRENQLIEEAFNHFNTTIANIKTTLTQSREARPIDVSYSDSYSELVPVYKVDSEEKLVDAYLAQYLSLEAGRRGLFPNWVKPSDSEVPPVMVHRFCQAVDAVPGIWDTHRNSEQAVLAGQERAGRSVPEHEREKMVLVEAEFGHFFERMDRKVLKSLLELVMDKPLAEYIISREGVELKYKDMSYTHDVGILRGRLYSPWLFQLLGTVLDVLLLGRDRAHQLAGPPSEKPRFLVDTARSLPRDDGHPFRLYMRNLNKFYLVVRLSRRSELQLRERFLAVPEHKSYAHTSATDYPQTAGACWPRDGRMRLVHDDVLLGRALFFHLQERLPTGLCDLDLSRSNVSVYSAQNPCVCFSMADFEVRLLPRWRADEVLHGKDPNASWEMRRVVGADGLEEPTTYVHLQVAEPAIRRFETSIRSLAMVGSPNAYEVAANRWNAELRALLVYFREAARSTPRLMDILVKGEERVQNLVKKCMNTKMPKRFPPVIFYSPKMPCLGLGMYSVGHVLLPQADARQMQVGAGGVVTHFRQGLSTRGSTGSNTELNLPNLMTFIPSWQEEIRQSNRVFSKFVQLEQHARMENKKVRIEDLGEESLALGLPRLRTLFHREKEYLLHDKDWRLRRYFKRFREPREDKMWWTERDRDGQLWDFERRYEAEMVEALGGLECIMDHTLFRSTGLKSFDAMQVEKKSAFESSMRQKALTRQQQMGLAKGEPRRFALWWSPTMNRADVYVGFCNKLDMSGVRMHAKLATLKQALIQVWKGHLWQNIHRSIGHDLQQAIDRAKTVTLVGARGVEACAVSNRKSYDDETTCADFFLHAEGEWPVCNASAVDAPDEFDSFLGQGYHGGPLKGFPRNTGKLFFDVQLRWGNYDERDPRIAAREWYSRSLGEQLYDHQYGVVVVVDVAYHTWSAFGNWVPGLKPLLAQTMRVVLENNPALEELRVRLRNQMRIKVAQPTESAMGVTNLADAFSSKQVTWIVDPANVRVVVKTETAAGIKSQEANGALLIFEPRTGEAQIRILHSSIWRGKSNVSQDKLSKTAEEVRAAIRALPADKRPHVVTMMEQRSLNPLRNALVEFPNIVVRGSDLSIPFRGILQDEGVARRVQSARESSSFVLSLYDDWLAPPLDQLKERVAIQAATAFERLILILRGLHVSPTETRAALRPNRRIKVAEGHLWPTLAAEWRQVETAIKEAVLQSYCDKNNVKLTELNQQTIRDILLGAQVKGDEEQELRREQFLAEQKARRDALRTGSSAAVQVITTRVKDPVTGEWIVKTSHKAVTSRDSEFESSSDWATRLLANSELAERAERLRDVVSVRQASNGNAPAGAPKLVLPQALLKQLVASADTHACVGAYMFGRCEEAEGQDEGHILSVHSLVFAPQVGTSTSLQLAHAAPTPPQLLKPELLAELSSLDGARAAHGADGEGGGLGDSHLPVTHPALYGMVCLGVAYTCSSSAPTAPPLFAQLLAGAAKRNDWDPANVVMLQVSLALKSVTLMAHRLTPAGMRWGVGSATTDEREAEGSLEDYDAGDFTEPANVASTAATAGFCLVPPASSSLASCGSAGGPWQYSLARVQFDADARYQLVMDAPLPFYHMEHRRDHFLHFSPPDDSQADVGAALEDGGVLDFF